MNTTDTTDKVREHYSASGLVARLKIMLSTTIAEDQPLTVSQLAPLDQFHIRGIQATAELAGMVVLDRAARVLDMGCGVGGPARYLAATFDCQVTGIDLSPGFIDAAAYLSERCGLADKTTFEVADALHLPFEANTFDVVFLQHVAMNVEDRGALYAEIRRVLSPGGRFATYDVVLRNGGVVYPVPWARDASTSFVRTETDTRQDLENAGFSVAVWRDDTRLATDWFKAIAENGPPSSGPNLSAIMGPDFVARTRNLARNLGENRLGVVSAILTRD